MISLDDAELDAKKRGFETGLDAGKQALRDVLWFELSKPDEKGFREIEFVYEVAYVQGWNEAPIYESSSPA